MENLFPDTENGKPGCRRISLEFIHDAAANGLRFIQLAVLSIEIERKFKAIIEGSAGGKPFDIDVDWFCELLADIGQIKGGKVEVSH